MDFRSIFEPNYSIKKHMKPQKFSLSYLINHIHRIPDDALEWGKALGSVLIAYLTVRAFDEQFIVVYTAVKASFDVLELEIKKMVEFLCSGIRD